MTRSRHALRVLFLIALAAAPLPAAAQDSQYWTIQYGNRARLLGGAVVGSATDLSAVYYNPGLLSLLEENELILAGSVYQISKITVKNALGQGTELDWSKAGGVPSLFAGELRFRFLGKHRLAYAFLTRSEFDMRIESRGNLTAAPGVPDPDLLSVNLGFENRMSDYWAGLNWSYPVGDQAGLGISQFFSVRGSRLRSASVLQAKADSAAGISYLLHDADYETWSLIWKVGAGIRRGPWRIGLTATTPNLQLRGSGKVGFDETVIVTDPGGPTPSLARVISDFQRDLPATWKAPASAAVGVAYSRRDQTRLHLTAEWFAGLGTFKVLDAKPVTSPDGSQVRDADVVSHMDAVLNFGVGVEHRFTDRVEGYASFRTDFSAAKPDPEYNATTSIWDIYHVAAGSTFEVSGSEFTLGAIYASGSEPTRVGLGLLPEDLGGDELPGTLDTRFSRLTFILGFALTF